jgi:hypothetical protein
MEISKNLSYEEHIFMARKQYSKELKLELVKKHLPTKEHKGLKVEISFSFYGSQNLHKKLALTY